MSDRTDDLQDLVEHAVAVGDALPGDLPAQLEEGPEAAELQSATSFEPKLGLGFLAALAAVVVWSCPALIGKSLPLSSLTVVLFRGWIGVAFALTVLKLRGGRLSIKGLRLCLIGGAALGFDLALFFAAIKSTTVANATLISSMTPLLLLFLAPLLFGEKLRWPDVVAALAAMVGAGLVTTASASLDGWSLRGDLYAVLCLVAWTAYLSASKAVRGKISAIEFSAGVALIASTLITPVALLHADLSWPEPRQFLLLTIMGITGWLGHVLMNWALKNIPIWAGGTSAMAVPVVATILAAIFLGEQLVLLQGVGMAIVMIALTVVGVRSPKLAG